MDNYVAALFLPHTDVDRFPHVKAQLERRKSVLARMRKATSGSS
jgi:hypothetical protein